jgi:glycosyltransferase involved in cell wall biosynthesis
MHGGAVTLARRFLRSLETGDLIIPDLLLFTDMVDMSTFLALVRRTCPDIPAALYMHENQLTYPLPASAEVGPMRRQKGERDLHYSFVNFVSMLSADRIYFNSEFHRRELFVELPKYLRHFPEYRELQSIPALRAKSKVLPVGIDFARLGSRPDRAFSDDPPLIVWNQRWEYDKNPGQFFGALTKLAKVGRPFQLAVCGENYAREPSEFDVAREQLADRIVHWGYASLQDYARLLWQATATASTAVHEFFGISVMEAMYCETYAALPDRLSYPELLSDEMHKDCLYDSEAELVQKLRWAVEDPESAQEVGRRLSQSAIRFDWRRLAPVYDSEFERLR